MGVKKEVEEYIDIVCSQVKSKEIREYIKSELWDHVEEKIYDLKLQGLSEEEAIQKAVSEMGDAATVGKQLNESHKGTPEWGTIALVTLLSCIGFITVYFIMKSGLVYPNMDMFYKNIVFNLIGCSIAVALYFFDYRKIERYGKHIYIGTTVALLFQVFTGVPMNGARAWLRIGMINVDIVEVSLFLYAIALAKIVKDLDWESIRKVSTGFALLMIPLVLYVFLNTFMQAVIYFVIFIGLMALSRVKVRYVLSMAAIIFAQFLFYITHGGPYRVQRLITFLHPEKDPLGAGYLSIQIAKILKTTGLFGNGFSFPQKTIPEVHTDFILTYIIYTFGWIAGIAIITMAFLFITRMMEISQNIKNSFGNLIIKGFMCIFAVKFLWNIGMILGVVPVVMVNLPFISYGGTAVVIQMAAIGMIVSIYRRRNFPEYVPFAKKKEVV